MEVYQASLFDPPQDSVLVAAQSWIDATLFGSVASILCVLAVAIVGLSMMSGRLAIRDAFYVILGCFVLLGAPTIAGGIREVPNVETIVVGQGEPVEVYRAPALPERPPAGFDPYAGASLRSD